RAKISRDPNNTAWTRSSTRFGQKLLLSQGWKPGSTLGINGAPYINKSSSLSHIQVATKDNNLGLGADNGSQGDEAPTTTGLEGLQALLGRLNGKDNELLEREHRVREDSRRSVFTERRWGTGSFVSGGFLVGDRIQNVLPGHSEIPNRATGSCNVKPGVPLGHQSIKNHRHKRGTELEPQGLHDPDNLITSSLNTSAAGLKNERQAKRAKSMDNSTPSTPQRKQKRAQKSEMQVAKVSKKQAQRVPDPLPARSAMEEQTSAAEAQPAKVGGSLGRHAVRQRSIQHKKMSLVNQKALNELFGRGAQSGSGAPAAYPTPIATAAANAQAQQRRRLSITSLGLSGSPTQASAFARARQGSLSSGTSYNTSIDENAIEEGDAAPVSTSPHSPIGRRLSSGARALRDVRIGSGNTNGRSPNGPTSAPSVKGRGEAFNWSEQLRNRAERSSSITSPPTSAPGVSARERQAATAAAPPVEVPAKPPPKLQTVPDHFQERILKGDFIMD
ncbi:MAG: hypothetical protein Q9219_001249, partial [cf. Caloplaca sp. 3 TL-2023]